MPITGSIGVDETAGTCTILFVENGKPVAEFIFQAEMVTASALPLAIVFPTVVEFEAALKLFIPWVQMVRQVFNPPRGKEGSFEFSLEKEEAPGNGKLGLKMTLGGTNFETEWEQTTGQVTVASRLAVAMRWADLNLFLTLSRQLIQRIREF